jgi:ubiquinone/menaquinone biosynthesis C-methylase UbiE
LAVPNRKDWLDVGCGTDALTRAIIEHENPNSVIGIDASPGYTAYAKARTESSRARFEVGDA